MYLCILFYLLTCIYLFIENTRPNRPKMTRSLGAGWTWKSKLAPVHLTLDSQLLREDQSWKENGIHRRQKFYWMLKPTSLQGAGKSSLSNVHGKEKFGNCFGNLWTEYRRANIYLFLYFLFPEMHLKRRIFFKKICPFEEGKGLKNNQFWYRKFEKNWNFLGRFWSEFVNQKKEKINSKT